MQLNIYNQPRSFFWWCIIVLWNGIELVGYDCGMEERNSNNTTQKRTNDDGEQNSPVYKLWLQPKGEFLARKGYYYL